MPYSVFVGAALDEFFAHGGAGRAGADFVTSPEVGPAVRRARRPRARRVVRRARLARIRSSSSRRAPGAAGWRATCCGPARRARRALRYVMVERSATLRAEQRERLTIEPWEDALGPFLAVARRRRRARAGRGDRARSSPRSTSSPRSAFDGVILANELLDNLPFDVVERTAPGWARDPGRARRRAVRRGPGPRRRVARPGVRRTGRRPPPAAARDRGLARRLRDRAAPRRRRGDRLRGTGRGPRGPGPVGLAAHLPGPPARRRPARRHPGRRTSPPTS